MSETVTRQTGSFEAVDATGRKRRVYLFTRFIVSRALDGTEETPGLKTLQTAEGHAVKRISKGVYEVVGRPPVRLTSDDPAAP